VIAYIRLAFLQHEQMAQLAEGALSIRMYLLEHGTDEVGRLKELQIDVHMEGHLPPSL